MSPLPPRSVALIGAVCLTVGWLLASTLTPPVAQVQTLAERQPAGPLVPDAPLLTERLQLRLQQPRVAPTPRRNPFVFGQRAREKTPTVEASPKQTGEPASPTPPVPVGPIFTLAGIGITAETRTAILTDGDAVHVLKVGERLGGYDIVEITENSVTLAEASGLRWTLRLK